MVRRAALPYLARPAVGLHARDGGEVQGRAAGPSRGVALEDFEQAVSREPHLRYEGPYRNPDDLARIYGDVHFAWAIDFFEAGLNSQWLLPNRLYEGCLHGAVPIAIDGTETAAYLRRHGLGVILPDARPETLRARLGGMTRLEIAALAERVRDADETLFRSDAIECRRAGQPACRNTIQSYRPTGGGGMTAPLTPPVLIVVPTLNEERHIGVLLDQLSIEADALDAALVVADGGSTDGTRSIVAERAARNGRIVLLDNPRRIQSAAVNLAVARHGADATYRDPRRCPCALSRRLLPRARRRSRDHRR